MTTSRCHLLLLGFLALGLLGCAAGPTPTPTSPPPSPAVPEVDPYFAAQGGGEPRTAGYWLLWNSCAPDNRSETAAANGGREAGWIIMDDLLQDPGILLGEVPVTACQEGLNIFQGRQFDGINQAGDAAYELAGQLLAAQLNLAVGAEYCPAVDDAVRAGQLLLISLGFNGFGRYLGQEAATQDHTLAADLAGQLLNYNTGQLCR